MSQIDFQFSLRDKVLELLGGIASAERIGNIEEDIKVTLNRYEVWIYKDGANILGPSTDMRFEVYDFDSLDHLAQAVLKTIASLPPDSGEE